jgi:protein-disulfide isomerase
VTGAAIAAVLAAVLIVPRAAREADPPTQPVLPTLSRPTSGVSAEVPEVVFETARGVTRGNPDAEITIIEFVDFQCPPCRVFSASVKPVIEAEFVATGVAKFVIYDFPLTQIHPNAFVAARAAHCAEDQDKFWEFHDVLFRDQSAWAAEPSPVGRFEDYAGDLGMDAGAFSSCVRSDEHAALVGANVAFATQMQVPGTPTILVGKGQSVPRRVPSTVEGIRAAIAALQTTGG